MKFAQSNKSMILSLLMLPLLLTQSSLAQEEIFFLGEELGVGTRAMAMGGAYVGVADDYSAIYWNPAGLAQLRRGELNLGFSHNEITNNASFLGEKIKGQTSFSRLNSVGIVMPVPTYRGSLVFGIGYNKVRDFDNIVKVEGVNDSYAAYKDIVIPTYEGASTTVNGNLYQNETVLDEGSLNHFSIAGAMEVQKDFYLGATLNFVGGTDDYSVRFSEEDVYNLYNTPFDEASQIFSDLDYWDYNQRISSEFSGVNVKVGAFYRFGTGLNIGAAIVTPTRYTIKETWSESWDEYYDNESEPFPFSDEGEYEYQIQEPYGFNFGASFKFLNFLFAGGFEFKDWSQAKFRTDPPIYGMTKTEVNARIKDELQSVAKIHLGAEAYIPLIKARVRAGFFSSPSPYRNAEYMPDKEYYTAGASLQLDKQVMVDVGLVHGIWEKTTVDNLTKYSTLEDMSYDKIIGTLSIRF